jgi:anti-sigma-K factor RskA
MSCPDRELLFLHAADALDDAERSALEAHLATGCPHCHEGIEEERQSLGAIAEALPPIAPPRRIRERVLERVHNANGGRAAPQRAPLRRGALRPRRAAVAALAAAAAAAVLGFGLASWQLGSRQQQAIAAVEDAAQEQVQGAREELAALEDQLAEQDEEQAALEAELGHAADVAQLLRTSDQEELELAAARPDSAAWGRVLWDEEYRCYFRASGLEKLPAEQHYVVWMVGPDAPPFAAGALVIDGGDATLFTRLPRELSPVVRSFVTAETTPEPDAPSERVVLRGEAGVQGL